MADLSRFVEAQGGGVYERALAEITAGEKRSHWMWFVFPQVAGLGRSATAERYAIRDLAQARAYLEHPVLGPRLEECCRALLGVTGRTVTEIFGYPDDLKLRSSMTLFAAAAPEREVFAQVLQRYTEGADQRTLDLLGGRSA